MQLKVRALYSERPSVRWRSLLTQLIHTPPGVFSFVSWPFSLKILWAPLVDSLYFKQLGQRRTWLIPVQVRVAGFHFSLPDADSNPANVLDSCGSAHARLGAHS
jgi:hypothetical protein